MNGTEYSSADILARLFSSISSDRMKESSEIHAAWNQTLMGIKGFQNDGTKPADYGSQLADHSSIIDLKDGVLVVETDHPGRIQMFQLYKRYILNGLKQRIPGIPVSNIVFKLRKPEKVSGALRLPTREEFDKAAVFQESMRAADAANCAADAAPSFQKQNSPLSDEAAKNIPSPNKQQAPLPPELQDMFDSMKDSLLE